MRKQRRSSFFSYVSRAARRAWHDGKDFLLEQVVFAIVLLLVATWLNIRMGYMQFSEGRHSLYAALLTYGFFTLLYLGYLVLRCGWLVDEDRLEGIADREKEVGRLGDECKKLRDPVFDFGIGCSSVRQLVGPGQFAFHRRIGITNKSNSTARECELALVSCSDDIPGLTPDSALQVKDAPLETRKTDINQGDTKHFDLFVAFLTPGTEAPLNVLIWTPNHPTVPRHKKVEHEIVLRLTGANFSPRSWRVRALMGEGDAEVLKLEPLAA